MSDAKTELLARIAWLYYVNKKTQEEIGNLFGLSRPSVQRHLNQALDSRIVVTRIDHQQISQCMELSERLCERALPAFLFDVAAGALALSGCVSVLCRLVYLMWWPLRLCEWRCSPDKPTCFTG